MINRSSALLDGLQGLFDVRNLKIEHGGKVAEFKKDGSSHLHLNYSSIFRTI